MALHATNVTLSRRTWLKASAALALGAMQSSREASAKPRVAAALDRAVAKDWLARWQRAILDESNQPYCHKETGEEIGWLISHILTGYYYGYLATGDTKWIDRLSACAAAWLTRAVKEPDGFLGWPKENGASTGAIASLFADSLLGEAMGFRPLVLMAGLARKTPELKDRYSATFDRHVELAERTFDKWESRGCWRNVGEGGVWVAPEFGIDTKSNAWTDGYARRATEGFSLPANKQNLVTLWLLALHDATGKPVYRERARRWFVTMKSRMQVRDGKYFVWNYWDPAGPWDYKPDGSLRHWVGVHPNGGYYAVDLEGIVAAHEHGLVFDDKDIDRLVSTNRTWMWDGKIQGARFRSINGGPPDPRWKETPGVLWEALVSYDATLNKIFVANHVPDDWGGLTTTPRYLASLR